MSRNGTEIGSAIAAGVPTRTPWPAVGDAVAAYFGRVVYYFSSVAVGAFPQSLAAAPPNEAMLTALPTAATPAYIAQAVTAVGVPGLAVWPAHRMMLHLLTRATFLPLGDTYGILVTLAQVYAADTMTIIGQHVAPGDQFFTEDMESSDWQENDLPLDIPQIANSAGMRLAVLLQVLTTSTDPVYVELAIGGIGGSCIDTSLLPGNAGSPDTDRKVASGATDTTPSELINKVESLDGSLVISEDTARRRVNFQTAPAASVGGKLWTAYVPDPLLHPAVDAHFASTSSCGGELFLGYWTEIATGVWRKNEPGLVSSDFTDDVAVFLNMRLFAWLGVIEEQNSGIYVLTDTGLDPVTHEPTYAQMQRADDMKTSAQVKSGMHFLVTGGTAWGGASFELTTPDPIELNVTELAWSSVSPAPTTTPTYELLTAAQLSLAGPDTNQATAFASVGTGEVELQIFTEHDTALGGQTIPADGAIRFHVPAFLWEDNPDADTVVHCYLRAHVAGQDEAWVPVAVTQALHNTAVGTWLAVGTMGADYPIPIGSAMQARYTVTSTAITSINLNFVYNDSAHSSYIELPLTVGFAGTSYHPDLSGRELENQHPRWSSTSKRTAPTLDGSGNLTSVAGYDIVNIPAGATVNRIETNIWTVEVIRLSLFFPSGGHLADTAGNSGTLHQLSLGNFGGLSGSPEEAGTLDFGNDGFVNLVHIGTSWILDGAANMGRT